MTHDKCCAYAKLGKSIISKGMSVKTGFGTDVECYDGKEGCILFPADKEHRGKWIISKKTPQDCSFIYVKINDDLRAQIKKYENLLLEIEYFDVGKGSFTVEYSAISNENKLCEIVDLRNSKKWLTHTFELEGACFDESTREYDFKIGVYSEVLGNSLESVCIGKINLTKQETICPIYIEPAVSDNAGNIFFNSDKIKISYNMTNKTEDKYNLKAEYSVIGEEDCKTIWNFTENITFEENGTVKADVMPNVKKYGLYYVEVKLYDDFGKVMCKKRTRLSKINSSLEVKPNMSLGFSDHFAQGGKGDPWIPLELMRKGGFGINRDEILWKHYEKELDKFVFPDFEENYLKAAQHYSIEPCYTLGKNNENIEVINCPARTEYEQNRWREYVRHIANELKGRVKLYSIYNEPNLALKKTENVHWYVEDLKIAYEEIKAIDPNAKVLGFTAANIPYYWLEEAFRQGALNYCDIVDIHPYCWNTSPEEFDFIERIKRVYALIKKYGGSQEVWNTEFGYPVVPKGCGIENEYLQGIYLMHTYLYARANNVLQKFYIYQFADANFVDRLNPESEFGIVHSVRSDLTETPYAAKPAFAMLANLNNLISDAECLGEFFCHDRMTMIRFKKPDGREIFIYWAYWNTIDNELTMDFGTDSIKIYDVYGNSTEVSGENGIFKLKVSYETLIVEGRFTKFEDLSDYPA